MFGPLASTTTFKTWNIIFSHSAELSSSCLPKIRVNQDFLTRTNTCNRSICGGSQGEFCGIMYDLIMGVFQNPLRHSPKFTKIPLGFPLYYISNNSAFFQNVEWSYWYIMSLKFNLLFLNIPLKYKRWLWHKSPKHNTLLTVNSFNHSNLCNTNWICVILAKLYFNIISYV